MQHVSTSYCKEKPLAIDLYAGLGGWTEGLLAEGYEVVGFDIERHAYLMPEELRDFEGSKGTGEHPKRGWTAGTAISLGIEGSNKQKRSRIAKYPAQLVLQDVLTIHGSQFREAALIVASPPCQNYSYLAMPWSRSKDPENSKAAKALRRKWETEGPDNRLFDACFRIQREAIESTSRDCPDCSGWAERRTGHECRTCDGTGEITRYIPLVVENVRGAQPWVGPAKANYGSFYLWGDVEMVGNQILAGERGFGAGLRVPGRAQKVPGFRFDGSGGSFQTAAVEGMKRNPDGTDHPQGSWFRIADSSQGDRGIKQLHSRGDNQTCGKHRMGLGDGMKAGHPERSYRNGHVSIAHLTNPAEHGTKIGGDWFSDPNSTWRKHGSRSNARKAASAQIAKIPLQLARYIAHQYKPKCGAMATGRRGIGIELKPSYYTQLIRNVEANPWYEESEQQGLFTEEESEEAEESIA